MTSRNHIAGAGEQEQLSGIRSVSISIASADDIRSWSSGEVTKPVAFDSRNRTWDGLFGTRQYVEGGLLCQRIFGPAVSYRCACGKYKGSQRDRAKDGNVCDRCGVLVSHRNVQRYRMGHIELAAPVVHPFFYRGSPSILTELFKVVLEVEDFRPSTKGVTRKWVEEIIRREVWLDCEDGAQETTGAECVQAILKRLGKINVLDLLEEAISNSSSTKQRETLSALAGLFANRDALQRTSCVESLVLKVLPVVPPISRKTTVIDGTDAWGNELVEVGDLNRLYGKVIRANNALKDLLEEQAPEELINRRKRSLQKAVNALYENESLARPIKSISGRPLGSLLGLLKGKPGRFRRSLLGKRVDYSGRAVIVVNPRLQIWQCGLPEKIAWELFKPFVFRQTGERNGQVPLDDLDTRSESTRDALQQVMANHPVLLNRAPTLHRMNVQAFYPVLGSGNAIEVHPLVCRCYNADFDGDQMAVHLPLSIEAQEEAKSLLLSSKNLLSPANGKVMFSPSQDIVMGLYYMTREDNPQSESKGVFRGTRELEIARSLGHLSIQDNIDLSISAKREVVGTKHITSSSNNGKVRIKTTVGRALFSNMLDEKLPFYNLALSSRDLASILEQSHELLGVERTVELAEQLAQLGFRESTTSGLSIGVWDLKRPQEKERHIEKAEDVTKGLRHRLASKTVKKDEYTKEFITIWNMATNDVAKAMMETLQIGQTDGSEVNPLLVMAESGARGSITQLKQLAGMRGLMAKANGEVSEHPITSNFREGLSQSEFFISTHGSRKSFSDVGLKTAEGGYLSRRLVHATSREVVTIHDCGTKRGIIKPRSIFQDLDAALIGRISLQAVRRAGKKVLDKNELISENAANLILQSHRQSIEIRSPVTCEATTGVCQLCYGIDRSTQQLAEIGTAVGIIAAQSIGEPGTQLTMQTKHTGGIAGTNKDMAGGLERVEEVLEARCQRLKETFEFGNREELITFLIGELRSPYLSQGVSIDQKHFELVIAQMINRVRIERRGDSHLPLGKLLDRRVLSAANASLPKGAKKAVGKPQLVGITQAAMLNESFLAAASFREPKQVLRNAALSNRKDQLRSITENVIVGGLIPAGTGYRHDEMYDVVNENEDRSMTTEKKKKAPIERLKVRVVRSKSDEIADPERTQTLEELVTSLGAGSQDHQAWNRIIELCFDRLYEGIFRAEGVDEDAARRLTSKVFRGVIQSKRRFSSEKRFWAFVWKRRDWTVKNYLAREMKRRRRERQRLREMMERDLELPNLESQAKADSKLLETIRKEARLTGYQQQVFELAWIEGLSDSQIAERLEKTNGAIRRTKAHVKRKLQETPTAQRYRKSQ